MPDPLEHASESDATNAYLFLCLGNGHYAISNDRKGRNLPPETCSEGWKFIRSFALGVREPLPMQGDPEPIIRALRDTGYYIPSEGGSMPHGTSQ